MDNVALYSKYRPKTFDDIHGQDAIVQTLRNQITAQRIGHSYLFFGLRGSGKTSLARIFARAINCENPINGNPCEQCQSCQIKASINPDLMEIDAASNNSIDNIRNLVEEIKYKPTFEKYKIYIIDEVHMLSNSAFNVLLKTIEEPPPHAIFIMCTTELRKVPNTIKSRCQIYNFKYIQSENIKSVLTNIIQEEKADHLLQEDIIKYISDKSEGSLRDAISIIDQCIMRFYYEDKVSIEQVRQMFGDTTEEVIDELKETIEEKNIAKGLEIIREQYYNGIAMKELVKDLYDSYFKMFSNNFDKVKDSIYQRYVMILGNLLSELERNTQQLPLVEIGFIRMCKPEMQADYNSLVQRIYNLEQRLNSDNIPIQQNNPETINNSGVFDGIVVSKVITNKQVFITD